jgi:thiamine monophosphate kinase
MGHREIQPGDLVFATGPLGHEFQGTACSLHEEDDGRKFWRVKDQDDDYFDIDVEQVRALED